MKYFIHLLKKLTSSRQELFHLAALIVPASLSKALEVELFPKGIPAQHKSQGDFCSREGTCWQIAGICFHCRESMWAWGWGRWAQRLWLWCTISTVPSLLVRVQVSIQCLCCPPTSLEGVSLWQGDLWWPSRLEGWYGVQDARGSVGGSKAGERGLRLPLEGYVIYITKWTFTTGRWKGTWSFKHRTSMISSVVILTSSSVAKQRVVLTSISIGTTKEMYI